MRNIPGRKSSTRRVSGSALHGEGGLVRCRAVMLDSSDRIADTSGMDAVSQQYASVAEFLQTHRPAEPVYCVFPHEYEALYTTKGEMR